MDFSSMGSLDAKNEIKKFGINTSTGEVKTATIRTTTTYLDLLTYISEKMGVSRQAFMSKVLEQMSSEAVADYLAGYGSYMGIDDINTDMFADTPPGIDEDMLKNFLDQVQLNLLRMRLNAYAINALPSDNPLKVEYFKKTMKGLNVKPLSDEDIERYTDLAENL